ncbi:RNA polymerase sigma factor SigW [Bacillus sp. TS-2]|nr:RNA polymerase sigma factor SigW [Bacillus sp. TS-2]
MEEHWIKEIKKGDLHYFEKIIEKYKNPLYATILRMTKNPEDAQDLLQEVFIKLYHQIDKYNGKGSFAGWLHRVTVNHCLDTFRKHEYKIKKEEIQDYASEESQQPDVIYLQKENQRQLEKLISSLPEDERFIILLRYSNELSYEEIAESLNIPVTTVRNKLHRAKKKMRQNLTQKGEYFYDLSIK